MNAKMRGTEAPMDFQFTSRPNTKPVWASNEASTSAEPSTPRKRTHADVETPPPHFPPTLHQPNFGRNQNVPFIFQSPAPQTPEQYPWAPPTNFSANKAFPQPIFHDLKDVDMNESSPPGPTEPDTNDTPRAVATGALTRVFKSRQRAREKSRRSKTRDAGEDDSDEFAENDDDPIRPLTQTTSNHYTLNVPAPLPPQSDLPYILLGYLQFFFNLSLVLVFLYLVLQFILTVQRDVEHRISEYSMDIVQEIAMCASQYRNNHCESNPMPALIHQCGTWKTCMQRDPTIVGRARVGAELIAEVVNGFVEPISWKTLIFTLTSLSFLTVFINSLLSLYRARHQPAIAAPAPHPQSSYPMTPFPPQHFGGYMSPAPVPGWGRAIDRKDGDISTPTRKRRLESGDTLRV